MSSEDKSKEVRSPGEKPQKGITRKNFLKGSAAAILGVAATVTSEGLGLTATTKSKSASGAKTRYDNKKRSYFAHEADVVIVGGGLAGLSAARQAMKGGAKVIMVDKGPVGHSGATGMNWGMAVLTNEYIEGDGSGALQALLLDTEGIADQDFFLAMCKACHEEKPVAYSEQCGSVQQRMDNGKAMGANDPALPITFVRENRPRRIAEHLQKIGLKIIDQTMVLDVVLAPDGHVAGAVGIDIKSGDAHLFRGKTVILATGGYTWATGCTISGPDTTGEGHAMFIKRGLPMKDMEFFQVDFEGVRPYSSIRDGNQIDMASLFPINGDTFMYCVNKNHIPYWKGYFTDPKNTAYPGAAFQGTVTTAIVEILHGNGTRGDGSNNGILMDVSTFYGNHSLAGTMYGQMVKDADQLGYKFDKYAECIPDFYGTCGMPKMNPNSCETDIPGLYAPMHTISELGSFAAWSAGVLAGKDAAKKALRTKMPGFANKDVQEILNKAYGTLEATPRDPVRATEVCRRIQKTFYKGLHVIRNGKSMQEALNELLRIQKEDLPMINVPEKSRQLNRDWRNALEAENMLLCSIGTAYAALYRKETRPFHYRTDYPVMDNDNWLVNVWVTMKDGKWSIHKTPVVASTISIDDIKKMLIPVDLRKPNVY